MKGFKALLISVTLCLCFLLLPCMNMAVASAVAADDGANAAVSIKTKTFKDGKKYAGNQIAPQLDVNAFATLNTENNGGTHIDGDGNIVFSNYVIFTLTLNYDKSSKQIGNTGVLVSKDSCDFCAVNEANNYRFADWDSGNNTEKQISYGAICAIRTNPDGSVFKYAPIFSTGETYLSEQIFNADGDYRLFCFFESVKNGKYQNHIIEWSFKIRSYVYLIDAHTELPIKESGVSGSAILLDGSSRQNITVEVSLNGKALKTYTSAELSQGKIRLVENGKYKFVTRCGDFVCEVFYFTIDSEKIDKKVFFNNLKKQVGDFTYEAEGWFSFVWDDSDANPVQSAEYINLADLKNVDYEEVRGAGSVTQRISLSNQKTTKYEQGTQIEGEGTYLVRVQFKTAAVDYYINVVPMDQPSYNYNKLSAARFNSFHTKWYEVYDNINDRYLCFNYDTERDRAYDAAMTIANSSVIEAAGKYFFHGTWYNDRVDLTAAMNTYVFNNNLKVVYYDYRNYEDNDDSLRTFSSAAFDGTIYLDDQFQFMSLHPSEVASVTLISEDSHEYTVEFDTPISKQDIPNGKYTVIESDKYHNVTEYTAFRDKSAPVVDLELGDGTSVQVASNLTYTTTSFSIGLFTDALDDYAVLKINDQYFIRDEYIGIVYTQVGRYNIEAYDRNGNTVSCIVVIA